MNEEKMVLLTKFILKEAMNAQKINKKKNIMEKIDTESHLKLTNELCDRFFFKLKKLTINDAGNTEYMIEFLVN